MLVKLLVGLAGSAYVLDPGDEFHFPDDEAVRLIEAGHAVPVEKVIIERAIADAAPERRGRGKRHVADGIDTAPGGESGIA